MNDPESLDRLIDHLRCGDLDPVAFAAMQQRLMVDGELRRQYRERMRMEANLGSVFQADRPDLVPPLTPAAAFGRIRSRWLLALGTGLAAALAVGFFIGSKRGGRPELPVIAHIESTSEAAWSEGLPIGANKGLNVGTVGLTGGLAEIRFASGVLVALEAPARLELINPMRCRLHHGVAVFQVPEAGKGFIVEAPDGHAVDHGTRFAITVNPHESAAEFEVLDGQISVHHAKSGAVVSLLESEAARLTTEGIENLDALPSEVLQRHSRPALHRFRPNGREASIVRVDGSRAQLLDPDLLMVKKDLTRTEESPSTPAHYARDRRSLVGFQLENVNTREVRTASLRLNLVPTGLGFASALPETCVFQLYGIRDDASLETWPSNGLRWADAPGSVGASGDINANDVRLLAAVEIPRGRTTGAMVFSSSELAEFIREDTTGVVAFLLVRATPPLDSFSLVHAFAASTHPDAAGPTLELERAAQ